MTRSNENKTYAMLEKALADDEMKEKLIFGNERLVNEIIERYIDELSGFSVPVVRGFSALSPLPKPKTLSEAKKIVDGN